MARGRHQIPEGWKRERCREVYERDPQSECTVKEVRVYRGYVGGEIVVFVALYYDGERKWFNRRFSGRNLPKADVFLSEIQEQHGYRRAA